MLHTGGFIPSNKLWVRELFLWGVCLNFISKQSKQNMQTRGEKSRCHKVKQLPAVRHVPSATTRVNPAHALILTLYVYEGVYVQVCWKRIVWQVITFRLSLSGLKVPNHDCICPQMSQKWRGGGGREMKVILLLRSNGNKNYLHRYNQLGQSWRRWTSIPNILCKSGQNCSETGARAASGQLMHLRTWGRQRQRQNS